MKRLLTCALGMFVALSLTGCFSLLNENSSANSKAGAAAMDIVTLPAQAAAVVVGLTVAAPFQPRPSSKPPQPGTTKLYRFADGSIYEGPVGGITADRGIPDGHGRYTRPDGTDLSGKFIGGHPSEVQGTVVFGDGMKLVGEWHGHRRQGKGTISWSDGATYAGEWAGAVVIGVVREETGTNDAGEKIRFFPPMRSVPQGPGTMTWPDRWKFSGRWHQGLSQGHGQMLLPDGKVQEGFLQGDKFIGVQPLLPSLDGHGWLSFIINEKHAAVFLNGQWHGPAHSLINVPAGSYSVEVKMAGFQPYSETINIEAGTKTVKRVRLTKQ